MRSVRKRARDADAAQMIPASLLAFAVHVGAGIYEALHTCWRQICRSASHGAAGPGALPPCYIAFPMAHFSSHVRLLSSSLLLSIPRAYALSSFALISCPVRPPQPYPAEGGAGEENRAREREGRTRQSSRSRRRGSACRQTLIMWSIASWGSKRVPRPHQRQRARWNQPCTPGPSVEVSCGLPNIMQPPLKA